MIQLPRIGRERKWWFGSKLLKVLGFNSTQRAIHLLETGEHLWVRGIENVLIYIHRLGEANYRIGVYLVERMASRFYVKRLSVDARVGQVEVYRLVKKLGARPCKLVKNSLVDELGGLYDSSDVELNYQDFVNTIRGLGLRVQVNP